MYVWYGQSRLEQSSQAPFQLPLNLFYFFQKEKKGGVDVKLFFFWFVQKSIASCREKNLLLLIEKTSRLLGVWERSHLLYGRCFSASECRGL